MNTKKHAMTQFELSKVTLRNLNKFNLTGNSKLVLLSLTDKYPNIFPSQKFIATELGISKRSVERAFTELRAKGIIITSKNTDTDTLNCRFTNIFFEIVNLSASPRQSDGQTYRQNGEQRNNHEKTNKKVNSFYQNEGIKYKSPEQTRADYEKSVETDNKSPLNDKQTAINWIKTLTQTTAKMLPMRKMLSDVCKIHAISEATLADLNSLCVDAIKYSHEA